MRGLPEDIGARPGDNLVDISGTDVSARLFMRDIDTGGIAIEQIEGHFINRRSLRAGIQVAQGIDMGRAMIAH